MPTQTRTTAERPIYSRREALRWMGFGAAAWGCGVFAGCQSQIASVPVPPPGLGRGKATVWPLSDRYDSPLLDDQFLVRQVSGVRPYRRGAVRIEAERLGEKQVIHHYGHGGAGITLAPGTARDAVGLMAGVEQAEGEDIAVLGAGVVGMATAERLLDCGYRVTLYTERVTPNTTSDIAGGQFAPATVAIDNDQQLTRWMRTASDYYLSRIGRMPGIDRVINFTAGTSGGALRRLPGDRFKNAAFDRLPIAGMDLPGHAFETLIITPPLFLGRLYEDLQARGATIRFRRFDAPEQIAALPHRVVFNCMGLGSKPIFPDSRLVPIRGRLVVLRPQPLGYLFSHRGGYLFSRPDALILGGTYDYGATDTEEDPSVTRQILSRHRRFFNVV